MRSLLCSGNWGDIRENTVAQLFCDWTDFTSTSTPVNMSTPAKSTATGFVGIGLVGLADDLGVKLNNGRPGAMGGPDAFRQSLARYGTRNIPLFSGGLPRLVDFGNVVAATTSSDLQQDLKRTHQHIFQIVQFILSHRLFPIGIGGGHDLTLPMVRGVVDFFGQPFVGAYLDAHLDVRATIGSGMPFRILLEEKIVTELSCAGLDCFANSVDHQKWFTENGGKLSPAADIDWQDLDFVSLDLDVIDSAHAPGVIAPNPNGMNPNQIAKIVNLCGKSQRLKYFDIMEFCPPFDLDNRTGRLAAHLFCQFLAGWSSRI